MSDNERTGGIVVMSLMDSEAREYRTAYVEMDHIPDDVDVDPSITEASTTVSPMEFTLYAQQLVEAAATAEYYADVVKQVTEIAKGDKDAGIMMVSLFREAKLQIDTPIFGEGAALEPTLTIDLEPLVAIWRGGEHTGGQWTPDDCRSHALDAMSAAASAQLDTRYLRILLDEQELTVDAASDLINALAQVRYEKRGQA